LGHYNLRQLAPDDIAAYCKQAGDRAVVHDNANAPAPLHVHVIQGPAVDQAKVVAALNNCKLCLKIDRGRFGQAVAWRKKNCAGASEVEPALPALFDDMPVGTFATTTAATAAAAGPTDIASKDPVRDAQTVFTQANASGRNGVRNNRII